MPYKEKEIQKMFYTIGEVAEMFKVNTSHIRFWSKQFDIIKPATNKKGNRLFTSSDIENFKVIYHLVKEKGFTLKGAKVEMNAMRKKMRIEQNPKAVKADSTSTTPVEEVIFEKSPAPDPSTEEFVNKIAIRNNLEKLKASLLQLQNELTLMQQ